MFKRVLDTSFDWVWWIGFIGAVVLVFITKLGVMTNWAVLIYGVTHMTLLTLLGLKAVHKGKSNMDIGHRISTMGYLHTLIGTSVALILASSNNFDDLSNEAILKQMNSIIIPIGSALITSIIGWAVGTEMERTIHGTKEDTIVDHALKTLSNDINNLGEELEKSTKKWRNSIDTTVQSLADSTEDLEDNYEKALNKSSTKLDNDAKIIMIKYFNSFDNLFKQIENQVEDIEKNFKKSNDSATKVIEDLSISYKKLMNETKTNVDGLNTNLKESTNKADESINKFTTSFNALFNTMQTYSDTIQEDFKTSTNNAKNIMDELTTSFTNVFGQINIVSTEWETHIKNMKEFSVDSSSSLKGLLNDSKRVAREIQLVADGIPNSAQILREVDEILEVIRAIKESD